MRARERVGARERTRVEGEGGGKGGGEGGGVREKVSFLTPASVGIST